MTQKDNKNIEDLIREFQGEKRIERKQEVYNRLYTAIIKNIYEDDSPYGSGYVALSWLELTTELLDGYKLSRPKLEYTVKNPNDTEKKWQMTPKQWVNHKD